jgi:hypothetical protein
VRQGETLQALSPADREQLRHPLEKPVAIVVGLLAIALIGLVLALLILGAERLNDQPVFGKYLGHARLLLTAVLAAPLVATYARRKRQLLAQQESIHVTANQIPELYAVLLRQCARAGIDVPDLYLSDGLEHTTSFAWRRRNCIILSIHDFSLFPHAYEDVVPFVLAREVGAICLGHTSFLSDLLTSSVAPIPFLRSPLFRMETYSRDRYGAVLAPRAIRALIVVACGDRLGERVNLNGYFAQLDEGSEKGFWAVAVWLLTRRVPLAHRVQQLRRAGLLTAS